MRPQAAAKQLALYLDTDPALPEWIVADATRLKQVLFNLLSNAIKFSERGSVALAARLPPEPRSACSSSSLTPASAWTPTPRRGYSSRFAPGDRHSRRATGHRAGAGDLAQPGAHDGRRHHRGQRARRRQPFLFRPAAAASRAGDARRRPAIGPRPCGAHAGCAGGRGPPGQPPVPGVAAGDDAAPRPFCAPTAGRRCRPCSSAASTSC
jgi:hypothetical protein